MLDNKNFLTINRSETRGLHTALSSSDIPDADFSSLQNIRFSRFGFGPRLGSRILGTNTNTGTTGIKSLYVYGRADGTFIRLRSHTTFLEVYDGTNDSWYTLASGFTSGKRFAFTPFNKTTLAAQDNRLVFCNGEENYSTWNGAIGHSDGAIAIGQNTIDLQTGEGAFWSSSGTDGLIEGTDTFDWTGRTGDQLTGVSGIASVHADKAFITEAPDTSTHAALPKMNVMTTALGRIYGSGDTVVREYYSETGDNTDFTAAANYGDPGFEDFPEGNGPILANTSRDDSVIIWKERGIYQMFIKTFSNTSATTNKRIVKATIEEGEDVGCASPLGVVSSGGLDYFLTSRGGLHILGLTESGGLRPSSLTDRILPTIRNYINTSGAVGHDPDSGYILAATRGTNAQGQVGSTNNTIIAYDIFRSALSLWRGLNISTYAYDPSTNTFLGGDVTTDLVYELNVDGTYTDEVSAGVTVPITATAITKRFTFNKPAKRKKFNMYMVQGYISPTAKIKVTFKYNDGGTLKEVQKEITGKLTNDYVFRKPTNIFGAFTFGELAFGAEQTDTLIEGMNPFRVFCNVPQEDAYNFEVVFSSNEGESNGWWIVGEAVAPVESSGITSSLII